MRYEVQYMANLRQILEKGARELNMRTGVITRRIPSTAIRVDLEEEFPILSSKKVFWKSAVDEILWIMQKHSNRVDELNSKIWDNWARPDGTIGKSYGYQAGKPCRGYNSQVEYVLETLRHDTSNRQAVINLWGVDDLDDMALVPCVYSSVWSIIDGRLHCMLVQRSADYPVGVPFDTLQYAALLLMFARDLSVRPGILTHVMADSHIYENQIPGVIKQFDVWDNMILGEARPRLQFLPEAPTNFWSIGLDDLELTGYTPGPVIKYEVAV